MHGSVGAFVKDQVEQRHLSALSTLEVGSCVVNGSVRSLFTGHYWGIDWQEGPGVDEVLSAHMMHSDWSDKFDVVVCTEMLEHDTKPWLSVAEMARVLRPFGVLLLTARGFDSTGCFPWHNPPDNYRYSAAAIEALLENAGLLIEGIWHDPQGCGYFAAGVKP
jgi:SAM-dependent methyltransferase